MQFTPNSPRSTTLAVLVRDGKATEAEREEWGARTLQYIKAHILHDICRGLLDERHGDDIIGETIILLMRYLPKYDPARGCWNTFVASNLRFARGKYFRKNKNIINAVSLDGFADKSLADGFLLAHGTNSPFPQENNND